jgi:hypothetical protein
MYSAITQTFRVFQTATGRCIRSSWWNRVLMRPEKPPQNQLRSAAVVDSALSRPSGPPCPPVPIERPVQYIPLSFETPLLDRLVLRASLTSGCRRQTSKSSLIRTSAPTKRTSAPGRVCENTNGSFMAAKLAKARYSLTAASEKSCGRLGSGPAVARSNERSLIAISG